MGVSGVLASKAGVEQSRETTRLPHCPPNRPTHGFQTPPTPSADSTSPAFQSFGICTALCLAMGAWAPPSGDPELALLPGETGPRRSLWRNRLARSAVNRKVGGSSPPRDAFLILKKRAKSQPLRLFLCSFPSQPLPRQASSITPLPSTASPTQQEDLSHHP